MLEHPKELFYTHRFLWVLLSEEDGTAKVGITEELAEKLGDSITFEMPLEGDELELDHVCMQVHIENRIVPIFAPLTGRVLEANDEVEDSPDLMILDPYKNYIFTMEYDDDSELELLLSSKRYDQFLDQM